MNRVSARISAVVMSAVMILGTASCGRNDDASQRSYIYSAEEFEIPDSIDFASKILPAGDKLALLGLKENGDTYDIKLDILDTSGNPEREIIICSVDSASENYRIFESMHISKKGNLISAEAEFTGNSEISYYLSEYSIESGEKLSEIQLADVPENLKDGYDGIFCGNSGNSFIYRENLLSVFDKSGSLLGNIEYPSNVMERSLIREVYETSDGRIFAKINSFSPDEGEYSGSSALVLVDTGNMSFGKEFLISAGDSFLNGTDGHDLISETAVGLYGYDIETGNSEMIIDWVKSGVDRQDVSGTAFLSDGRIAVISEKDGKQFITVLTEVDISKLPPKKTITLYALYLYDEVKQQAMEFNKNSLEYEIEITEYAVNREERGSMAAEKLSLDLTAGKIPDIIEFDTGIYVDAEFPSESYMSKGMFADLYEFMDNDPSFSREEFLPGIFEVFEYDGKLYEAVPTFMISTLIGKAAVLGDKQGWTMEEFLDFAEKHKGEILFDRDTSGDILSLLMENNCGGFIDWEKGECRFDDESFARLLEVCAAHPAEKYAEIGNLSSSYMDGDVLLSIRYVLKCHNASEQVIFGGDYTYKGYPGNGSGSSAIPAISLAVTSKSENKEGAWEFVKSFFTKEYQDKYAAENPYYLPVRRSALEESISLAEAGYYFDENGEQVETKEIIRLDDGTQIPVPTNSGEDSRKLMELIDSVTYSRRRNAEVNRIINEEAAAFFAGQKSAEEVAEIIQNRVSNYLAENI